MAKRLSIYWKCAGLAALAAAGIGLIWCLGPDFRSTQKPSQRTVVLDYRFFDPGKRTLTAFVPTGSESIPKAFRQDPENRSGAFATDVRAEATTYAGGVKGVKLTVTLSGQANDNYSVTIRVEQRGIIIPELVETIPMKDDY